MAEKKAIKKVPVEVRRHSAAHIMAAAVMELFPEAKLGIGPAIEHGFYYDIDLPRTLTPEDLKRIEKRMRKIASRGEPFRHQEMPLDEAVAFFRERHQDYKVELLEILKRQGTTSVKEEESQDIDLESPDRVSLYWTGKFVDLCRGPHVESARDIGAFTLRSVAGAYWRGDEKNKMLQRIYGLAFGTEEELAAHLQMLEEAERRDHRKLGAQLELFTFSPLVGPGLPMFTTRGTIMRREIESFVMSLQEPYGYERVTIPHIAKTDLYATSGHLEKFEDDIFYVHSKKTDDRFVLKPMNCPHHTQIYASLPRSYRDLPIRMAEVTAVYRDENTGQLQGLSRVRTITQDDAHVFCTMEQVEDETLFIYKVITKFYAAFRMPLRIRLSTHDPRNMKAFLGSAEVWERAEGVLAGLLKRLGQEFEVGVGEAAFYGPKIDFIARDAIGRDWQLATIQLDFNLPERFSLEYVGQDGEKHRPVMIHRAVLGSVERFLGVLIEHYAGAFPVWLSPVQVQVIPVGKDHWKTARKLRKLLLDEGVRVGYDELRETVGYKIRKAEKLKVPYMLVIGEKEKSLRTVNVRIRGKKQEKRMTIKAFVAEVRKRIDKRSAAL
ncbi:threonyl-tRNA synthetase [Parcubacteria bacterium SG8_24]|nr:MAG: threonyl-tRNA synthetase [Parcubacteria bacterium SG8_24]